MPDNAYLVFEELAKGDHEQVIFCRDEASGLRAIIALHNTQLGPALGGCRMFPYANERDALVDVLRLSRGMTYKAAVSGLNLGGGKTVIIGDPRRDKSEAMWRSLGRFIHALDGRYITAEDSGSTMADMEILRSETPHVVGISRDLGGSGNPAPVTALGVFSGIRAAIEEALGRTACTGVRVSVQGCGAVGYHIIRHLVEAGAHVTATDVDTVALSRAVADFGVDAVAPDRIYAAPADVFAPCAMGGILNAQTIPQLTCKVVAGAANNQLADERADGQRLADRNILYAPDFAINAGGLINVANELEGYNQERALTHAKQVYGVLQAIFAKARQEKMMTWEAANCLAAERMAALRAMRQTYTGHIYSPLRRASRRA
jgi:leucine dehydrogenase